MAINELDLALAARGWRYEAGTELFMDGERQLDWEEVIALVPGMTRDDLVAYQDEKWDKLSAARQRNSQAGM